MTRRQLTSVSLEWFHPTWYLKLFCFKQCAVAVCSVVIISSPFSACGNMRFSSIPYIEWFRKAIVYGNVCQIQLFVFIHRTLITWVPHSMGHAEETLGLCHGRVISFSLVFENYTQLEKGVHPLHCSGISLCRTWYGLSNSWRISVQKLTEESEDFTWIGAQTFVLRRQSLRPVFNPHFVACCTFDAILRNGACQISFWFAEKAFLTTFECHIDWDPSTGTVLYCLLWIAVWMWDLRSWTGTAINYPLGCMVRVWYVRTWRYCACVIPPFSNLRYSR